MELSAEMKSVILDVIRVTLENLNYPEEEIEAVLHETEDGTFRYRLEDIKSTSRYKAIFV